MSVLGLKSGYTVKYGLNPRDFPRAQVIFYCVSILLSLYGYNIGVLRCHSYGHQYILSPASKLTPIHKTG